MSSGGQLWLQADPVLCSLSGAFSLYFWTWLLNGFLIDCDTDQWLAVAGLLSQYWIHSVSLLCLQPALLPSSSGTEGGLSMKLSSHSSVYTLQPLPDPVNVLSVSWHTGTLNNDPVLKSCTNKVPFPVPLNNLQRAGSPKKTDFLNTFLPQSQKKDVSGIKLV